VIDLYYLFAYQNICIFDLDDDEIMLILDDFIGRK